MRIGFLEADRVHEASRARAAGSGGDGHLDHSLERSAETVRAAREVLDADGHDTLILPVDGRLLTRLREAQLELVFNTYFGPARRQDQAHIASLMELADVPFTGGGAACHFIGLSKPLAKQIFMSTALPTPRFCVVDEPGAAGAAAERAGLIFPLIIKASSEGEGIGLDARSVVRSRKELAEVALRVISTYAQPALVEEFMPGREFTVGVLDGRPPRVLPILEIHLNGEPTYSYAAKTGATAEEECPARVSAELAARMGDLAMRAGRAISCRDFWRVDFRLDAKDLPRILEVNTLPGLQPGYSDITKMAGPAGMTYADLVRRIVDSALAWTRSLQARAPGRQDQRIIRAGPVDPKSLPSCRCGYTPGMQPSPQGKGRQSR